MSLKHHIGINFYVFPHPSIWGLLLFFITEFCRILIGGGACVNVLGAQSKATLLP
jgi:hypothetical protein